jgi:TRAP-type C4-dicarboxylate transport system permease small subunit
VFFAALLAGSVWLAADLWSAHEMSEVVGVPWRWMRLFANIALGATIIVLVRQVFAGRAR